MLGLVGHLAPWLMDIELFTYEFVTALLLRLLQLSMPDFNMAMYFSLAGGIGEVREHCCVCVRRGLC